MKIEIAQAKCKRVAESWRRTYQGDDGKWSETTNSDTEHIYNEILKAGDDANKIADAIGNKTWTHIFCRDCGESAKLVVVMGDSDTVSVCPSCLRAALVALEAVSKVID